MERLLSNQAASGSAVHYFRASHRACNTHSTRNNKHFGSPFAAISLRPSSQRQVLVAPKSSLQSELDAVVTAQINEELVKTNFIAETLLPTRVGKFRLRGYKHSTDGGVTYTEPVAIICGDVENGENVPVRVHDACFTSEVLGSLKCDCAEQLQLAMKIIKDNPPGVIIYLHQEGRGIGLANKIAAYSLQEKGLDTVDANRALGLPDDCREYTSVRNILQELKIQSIRLMTNNPRKIKILNQLGIVVTDRVPCIVEGGEFNQGYLDAKRDRMDHMLDGAWCYWNHEGEPSVSTRSMDDNGGMGLLLPIAEVEAAIKNGSYK